MELKGNLNDFVAMRHSTDAERLSTIRVGNRRTASGGRMVEGATLTSAVCVLELREGETWKASTDVALLEELGADAPFKAPQMSKVRGAVTAMRAVAGVVPSSEKLDAEIARLERYWTVAGGDGSLGMTMREFLTGNPETAQKACARIQTTLGAMSEIYAVAKGIKVHEQDRKDDEKVTDHLAVLGRAADQCKIHDISLEDALARVRQAYDA